MARFYPTGGGAPGVNPKALTATAGDVVAGAIAGVKDNYNPVTGTLTLTGNAQANHVLSGETFYTTNPKSKITGTMIMQSILSFSCAPYSANQIAFTWQNPSSGPFSGVIVIGKTGGYPTSISDGTRYYKGFGSNSQSSGMSSQIVSGFVGDNTYYFRTFSYTTINNEEWLSPNTYISNIYIAKGQQVFTSSTTFTIPNGVTSVDLFCVGGGGCGGRRITGSNAYCGQGGGGGYTTTVKNVSVTQGTTIQVFVGSGGVYSSISARNGGSSYFIINGSQICTALGGTRGADSDDTQDKGSGGSGGGAAGFYATNPSSTTTGGDGGSNGGNGLSPTSTGYGIGQHSSTRSFGESTGTLYSGGGGGGSYTVSSGSGGSGGGGNGGGNLTNPSSGTNGMGGGGGGQGTYYGDMTNSSGGSGIAIIRWGY